MNHNLIKRIFLIIPVLFALAASVAEADIPLAERQALIDIYNGTNGGTWTTNTNWNSGGGTECTWFGVTCNGAGDTVTGIDLNTNNLTGSLPATLNNLTGLVTFYAYNNLLTGSIPSLTGLTNLAYFSVGNNQLTGTIPSLTGLTNLASFYAYNNQLTGPIPSLAGLTNLAAFWVNNNQLTGPIPSLAGLTSLAAFWVNNNQLTGPIPSLAGLNNLEYFYVNDNQLSGDVPAVPAPTNALVAGGSGLCPNYLNHTADAAWDAATGSTPWYAQCTAAPIPVAAAPIPTLSQWGMIVLSILLVGAAVFGLRRQR